MLHIHTVGEELWETAIRETFEETGVKTEFVAMLCFRHMHEYRWGTDDIYFVCLLRPLTTDITVNPAEIAEAKWTDVISLANTTDYTGALHFQALIVDGEWRVYIDKAQHLYTIMDMELLSLYCTVAVCSCVPLCNKALSGTLQALGKILLSVLAFGPHTRFV